ncbi:Uncharacterised protein [Klebsiella quasipneumoniae]|nr:Uncharacterised protein [Klebsiella quasipneumoniae]
MLHACRGDLRGDHREASPGAGKRADVFRVKHGFRLHLVFGGDQLQGLDLTDINAEIANRHPGRHLPGVERVQGDLAAHGARRRFRSVKDAFIIQPRVGAAAVEVIETDRSFNGAGQRRGLNGEPVAVKFDLRTPFRPEDAVVGQQVAVLRLDMQIDIESVFARFDGDDLADGEFTIQHHRASLNVRQRLSGEAQGGGRHFAQAVFLRLFEVGIQRIAALHFAFFTRDHPDPAVHPFAGAGAQHLHAIEPHFDVQTTVHHKLAVAANQIAVFRGNRHLEGHPFGRQLALQHLADFHPVQHQRLAAVDPVALRRRKGDGGDIGLLQQRFIRWHDGEVITRFAFAGHQLKGIAGEQGADAGVIKGDLRLLHLNQRFLPQQGHHARVDGHLARDFAARVKIQFA